MDRKTCFRCKQEKSLKDFAIKIKATQQYQPYCLECQRAYRREHYHNNPGPYKARAKKRNKQTRIEYNLLICDLLKGRSCVDCGESDIVVLDFDHVRGKKVAEVTALVKRMASLKTIMKEIAKCEIRCANCHRRKTARDFKWARDRIANRS